MNKAELAPDKPVFTRHVAALLCEIDKSRRHPGLQLDKFSVPEEQKVQMQEIDKVCGSGTASDLLWSLTKRRKTMLAAIRAERFCATTEGPLTLHLARASGLENAGIHLHPVYGFACLPGSGLKGMARFWAETVWLADQENPVAAWNEIRAVFGWAPRSEEGKCWRPEDAGEPEGAKAGSIVFHDAWPTNWPRLEPDIVNNHHKEYYNGEGGPGDWEEPYLAYFISVAAKTTFDFALSPRLAVTSGISKYMTLAKKWLQAALVHEGAGAKTNAGYGRFRLEVDPQPNVPSAARKVSAHTLELLTPAFLAGAAQGKEDCDLRPPSIRGQLRWWWRTMHTAHLDHQNLARLEAAIWGSTNSGAALALSIRPETAIIHRKFNKSLVTERYAGPKSQGIRYAAYGMDETGRRRWYVEPGMRWTITFNARTSRVFGVDLPIEDAEVLRQGQIALWLFCRFGGIGSKARNGFGSFSDIKIDSIESIQDCIEAGARLRKTVGLTTGPKTSSKSSSLEDMLESEFYVRCSNPWSALDLLGSVMRSFAQKYKNDARKVALGWPRTIRGSKKHQNFRRGRKHHQSQELSHSIIHFKRFASPVHYHLTRDNTDSIVVRLTAFPSSVLPDIKTSREMLAELKIHIASELSERTIKHGD